MAFLSYLISFKLILTLFYSNLSYAQNNKPAVTMSSPPATSSTITVKNTAMRLSEAPPVNFLELESVYRNCYTGIFLFRYIKNNYSDLSKEKTNELYWEIIKNRTVFFAKQGIKIDTLNYINQILNSSEGKIFCSTLLIPLNGPKYKSMPSATSVKNSETIRPFVMPLLEKTNFLLTHSVTAAFAQNNKIFSLSTKKQDLLVQEIILKFTSLLIENGMTLEKINKMSSSLNDLRVINFYNIEKKFSNDFYAEMDSAYKKVKTSSK